MTTNTNTKNTETTNTTTNRKETKSMTKTEMFDTINAITDRERKLDAIRLINTTNIDHVSIWKDGSISVLYKSGKWNCFKPNATDIERELGTKTALPKTVKAFISKFEGIAELVQYPQREATAPLARVSEIAEEITKTEDFTRREEMFNIATHPIITEAIQAEYEAECRKFGDSDATPEICGIYGRACRQMNDRAARALCSDCPLRNCAIDAKMRPYIVAFEDATDGIYIRERYATEEFAYATAKDTCDFWAGRGVEGRVQIFNEKEGVTIYSANVNAPTPTYPVSIVYFSDSSSVCEYFPTEKEAYAYAIRELAEMEACGAEGRVEIRNADGALLFSDVTADITPEDDDDEDTAPTADERPYTIGIYSAEADIDFGNAWGFCATAEEAIETADNLIEDAITEGDHIIVAVCNEFEETIYQVTTEMYFDVDGDEFDTLDEALDEFAERIVDNDDAFDEMLDEVCGDVEVCGLTYCVSEVFSKVDPIAYRCALTDWADSERSDMDYELDRADIGEEVERYGVTITPRLRPVVQVAYTPAPEKILEGGEAEAPKHTTLTLTTDEMVEVEVGGSAPSADPFPFRVILDGDELIDELATRDEAVKVADETLAKFGAGHGVEVFSDTDEEVVYFRTASLPADTYKVTLYDRNGKHYDPIDEYASLDDAVFVLDEDFGDVNASLPDGVVYGIVTNTLTGEVVHERSEMLFTITDYINEGVCVNATEAEAVEAITARLKADTSDAFDVYLDEDLVLPSVTYFDMAFCASEILKKVEPIFYEHKKEEWARLLAEDVRDNALLYTFAGETTDAYGFSITATTGKRVIFG